MTVLVQRDYDDGYQETLDIRDYLQKTIDVCGISEVSHVYLNVNFRMDPEILFEIARHVRENTFLDVEVKYFTPEQFIASGLPLSRMAIYAFMAGRPIWVLPGFFADLGSGQKYVSEVALHFSGVTSVQASFSRTTLVECAVSSAARYPTTARSRGAIVDEIHAVLRRALGFSGHHVEGRGKEDFISARIRHRRRGESIFKSDLRYGLASALEGGRRAVDQLYRVFEPASGKPSHSGGVDAAGNPDADGTVAFRDEVSRIICTARSPKRGERSTAYADTTRMLIAEAELIELFLGSRLDQAAMAAWHERIVTVLRLAADAAERADRRRKPIIKKLKTLHLKYVAAERAYAADPKARRKIDRLAGRIGEEVGRFAEILNRSLPSEQPPDHYGIVRLMEPLNATIIAFFGGTDPVSFAPILAQRMSQTLAPLLTMSIAMGRLQREGVGLLNPFLAKAIIAAVDEIDWSLDETEELRECRSLAHSWLEDSSWLELQAAARAVASSGKGRSLCFRSFADHKIDDEQHEARQRAERRGGVLAEFRGPMPSPLDRFSSLMGGSVELIDPLYLVGCLTAVPPLYDERWRGHWEIGANGEIFPKAA